MSGSVAVLIPVYNAEKFLKECIDSVLNQTFTDFELYVCDDGSTDNSLAMLKEYAGNDSRVRIFENPRNMGIVATRNALLKAVPSHITFIAWLDSDDVMFPDRLRRQTDYLNAHPEIGGLGSALEIIDEESRITGYRHYPETAAEIRRELPYRNVLAQSSMMLRKKVIDEIGVYSMEYPVCEDYDLWLRCLEKYDFVNFGRSLLRYRMSAGQTKWSKLKMTLRNTLAVQKGHFGRTGKRMPLSLRMYRLAAKILLVMPPALVMKLFVALAYRKEASER